MKAVHIFKYGRFPILKELSVPELGNSDFLIKMKYAPVNPSDIFFYQGKYGVIKEGFPIVGFEGSGIIQKSLKYPHFVGKKVTVSSNMSNGTHATHIVSSLRQTIIWPDDADLQQISMAFVNPFSCVGLCEIVKKQKPQNVIISAAASQIGKMIISSLKDWNKNVKIIAVNRSQNKSDVLKQLGVDSIIVTDEQMANSLQKIQGKSVFLDCVGGPLAGKVFNSLKNQSQMVCFGRQSGEDLQGIDLGRLYYRNKKISGFWLNNWLSSLTKQQKNAANDQVVKNFNKIYRSNVRKTFKIQEFLQAYRLSTKDKSQGKVLLDLS